MSGQAKAELWEVDAAGKEVGKKPRVTVQFNPETLRISYASQIGAPCLSSIAGATAQTPGQPDQPGSASRQKVGGGSTTLTVQLWFDVTSVMQQPDVGVSDVRVLTEKVAYFIKPSEPATTPPSAPKVEFRWGTIRFTGVMESLDENLELFSTDGVPLRASMNMTIAKGSLKPPEGSAGGSPTGLNLSAGIGIGASASLGAGTQPLAQAEAGVSLQAMASASFGADADWQSIATANGIENPRLLQPGQLINMNARASASASTGASASFNLTGGS